MATTKPDWAQLHQRSKPRLVIAGFLQAATAIFFSIVGLIIATVLYFALDHSIPALLFLLAALIAGLILGYKAWLDLKGDPLVIRGVLQRKYTRRQSSSGGRAHYLTVDIEDCKRINAQGEEQLLSTPTGAKKLHCQADLYAELSVDEPVTLVCTPSWQAFQQLQCKKELARGPT